MIPGDLLSAFPHRQFHTLPGLLDSWAALPNSNPNACMPMQGGSLYHFYGKFSNREQSETNRNYGNAKCDYLFEYLRMYFLLYEDSSRPFLNILRTLCDRSKVAED